MTLLAIGLRFVMIAALRQGRIGHPHNQPSPTFGVPLAARQSCDRHAGPIHRTAVIAHNSMIWKVAGSTAIDLTDAGSPLLSAATFC